MEVREVRESSAKDVGEAITKISGLSKFRRGGIANDVLIRAFQKDNINVLIDDTEVHGACPQERYFALNRAMQCKAMMTPFCAWVGNPELKPSKNTELDLGLKYSSQRLLVKGTVFYSLVKDYITIHRQIRQNGIPSVTGDSAMSYANVDAVFYGFEADARANLFGNLFLFGGASYVRGKKDTNSALNINDKDVAEVPPLKARLGLRYDTGLWFVEGEAVATATQDSVDSDLREQKTSGYGVLNLKAGVNWKNLSLTAGVDNVLDKKYYEHTSFVRHPFMTGVKVPEPGRTFFLNASYRF